MAYWRVIAKGSIGVVEKWSTGANFGIVGLAPDVPDQVAAEAIAQRVAVNQTAVLVPAALRSLLSSSGNIEIIRVEKRAEDETVLSVAETLIATPLIGVGTANKTPQDSLVFSLRTSTPGPRGRGRLYWPALTATLSTSFQLTTPAPADVAAGAKTWLQAMNTAIDDYYISIAAALRAALSVRSVTDHVNRDVTSIQVGSILDTQRRRRDTLPESYTSVPFP